MTIPADPRTPGQVAFAAYWRVDPWTYDVPWAGLTPEQQRAWEAAAQAVYDDIGHFRFTLGQHVIWSVYPALEWQVLARHRHEGQGRVWITYDLTYIHEGPVGLRAVTVNEPELTAIEEESNV